MTSTYTSQPESISTQQLTASNRRSDNLAIWSHITPSLLANWINDKNSSEKVKININICYSSHFKASLFEMHYSIFDFKSTFVF
jgi:hypothetical protein